MNDGQVWLNGRLVPEAEGNVSISDRGFLQGDGLFETLRVEAGVLVDMPAHLDRLWSGLSWLHMEIPESRERLARAIVSVTTLSLAPVARARVTVSRGVAGSEPTRLVTCSPYSDLGRGVRARGVPAVLDRDLRVLPDDPLTRIKSLSYQRYAEALRRAEKRDAFEALLFNQRGRLAEGSRCNVIARIDGSLITPPVEDGCLPGTVRRRLLESGRVIEGAITRQQLAIADELVLTNSLIGVVPVARLDQRSLEVSGIAADLHGAWRAATA